MRNAKYQDDQEEMQREKDLRREAEEELMR
jgi:hypothetical protein